MTSRWPFLVSLLLLGLTGHATRAADQPSPPVVQPAPKETPAQACKRCKDARRTCKTACSGPYGSEVASDKCLDQCDRTYWRCIPPGHGCEE